MTQYTGDPARDFGISQGDHDQLTATWSALYPDACLIPYDVPTLVADIESAREPEPVENEVE